MGAITDYMFDTSFIKEVLSYLQTTHKIDVSLIDSDGKDLDLTVSGSVPLPKTKFYTFEFSHDIGGLQCSAQSDIDLENAEPHILICIKAINTLLLREQELQETTDEMLQLSKQLNFLSKMAQKLIGVNKLEECCRIVLHEISSTIEADQSFIQTKNKEDEKLEIHYNFSSQTADNIKQQKNIQETAGNTVILTLEDGSSALVSPLKATDGQIGNMIFLKGKEKRVFSAYEKKFVSIIESIISPTIETLRLYDSLQDLYLNTVKALAAAIDAKDEYTHGHSFRVAKYSISIARKMGLPDKQITDLEIAAYMHDLGKIGIPESILGKTSKLTEAEYSEIQKHPVYTDKILEPIHLPAFIVDAAIHHHERLDGSGYPHGLKENKISLFTRIISVADVFDAMTTERPYRDAMSVETVLKELCDKVDKEFDREAVVALISAIKDSEGPATLTKIYPNMKFQDLHNLNEFLLNMIDFIFSNKAPSN